MSRFVRAYWLICLCPLLPGCANIGPYRAAISSEDVNERILGVIAAGEARDRGAVPLLVDRLEDEDEAVRFFAIVALERITGKRFGYDYAKESRERAASVALWRAYIRRGEHLTARDQSFVEDAQKRTVGRAGTEM